MRTSHALSALLFPLFGAFLSFSHPEHEHTVPVKPRSVFEWLEQSETLKVTLETDLAALENDDSDTFQPAVFTFWDAMGQAQELLVDVKPRGKYRRRVCDFPPLKVRFAEEELYKRQLKPFGTLKLVTHCLSGQADSRDNLLREYLAYAFYNRISPMSFRVKLAEVTYVDSKDRKKSVSRLAFFIEPTDELAERLEGEEVEEYGLDFDRIESRNLLEMRLFQFFIGNADWDLRHLRNVKLVRHTTTGDLFAIPYDFDMAGWVDASYAVPNNNVGQYDVKDRLFLGNLPSVSQWDECYHRFEHHRAALENEIESMDALSPASRRELLRYIDTFFSRDGQRLVRQLQEEVSRA